MFDKQLLFSIGEKMKEARASVSVAESVTSGLVQCAFSNIPDASDFFQGGITVYNVGQKCRHLLLDPLPAIACNCVSEQIAQELAGNVCQLFTSQYGLGIVGYAARVPEKNIHSLHSFFAIARKGVVIHSGIIEANVEEGFPAQFYFTNTLLQEFLSCLATEPEKSQR